MPHTINFLNFAYQIGEKAKVRTIISIILVLTSLASAAQTRGLSGRVNDKKDGSPVPYASILIKESGLWAVTSEDGSFNIAKACYGKYHIEVQCLGFVGSVVEYEYKEDSKPLDVSLEEDNLTLDVVEVVAKKNEERSGGTSYLIDRNAIDHRQTLNLTDLTALLPGGKTIESTLMDDSRIALRSEASEKGNASFGTAVEVDGVRIDNNPSAEETAGASTRSLNPGEIESVEFITGVPSVEYGDLSNGVVKVNLRKGRSPLIIDASSNPHSRSYSISKGFSAGEGGVLNVSASHARSFSNLVSPHTAYRRNTLSLRYGRTLQKGGKPLSLEAGLSGNLGGYSSEADPDEILDSYTKVRDNVLRGNVGLKWMAGLPCLTNLEFSGNFSLQDKRTETYANASSASSQPYIHATEDGYHIAEDYSSNPGADIILGPTGYWYTRSYNDQKPVNLSLRLKAEIRREMGKARNKLSIGAQWSASGNEGRGLWYSDMSVAPTWREYRYDALPWMHNIAIYAENELDAPLWKGAGAKLTAGLRDDITHIGLSDYGTVSSLSPRFNLRLSFWKNKEWLVKSMSAHAGWGRSYKLPSFQVLYPAPTYSDILSFTPGSTADNRAYYAFYTYPTTPLRNPQLKWQYTDQYDLGAEMTLAGGTKISLSAFVHDTYRPYISVYQYSPFAYVTTGQSAIEGSGIASADRAYAIDRATGQVTMYDRTGVHDPVLLANTSHNAYNSNRMYLNGSRVHRFGLEWIIDFARIKPLRTSVRLDGKYYGYRGLDQTLFAYNAGGSVSNGGDYPLMAYYRGSSATSAGSISTAGISNGSESRQLNLNATVTTHIPKIRLIVSMRVESTLYWYKRSLSSSSSEVRAYALESREDFFGEPYKESMRDRFVAVYPVYYSTWRNPDELIPFAEKFAWAYENDRELYNNLARMVVRSNYAYLLNPNTLSAFFSANINVTKEIGDHISVSFYANNFFNNMGNIYSSQTKQRSSLFGSGYIPKFYYGMTLKIKI